MEAPQMNFAEYEKMARKMETSSLQYVIQDCQKALEAMPDNPKAGYYMDEIHICAAELRRRQNR